MTETAIILAGGFGTRLQSLVSDVPKPMAPVNSEPFLNYQLRYLKHYGIRNIIFSIGHLGDKIQHYYTDSFEGLEISYVLEKEPLGTGGGIRLAINSCEDELTLVLNGDSLFEMNLHSFFALHQQAHSKISLALRQVDDAARYGTIISDSSNTIISFKEKNNSQQSGKINAGVYLIDRKTYLANTPADLNFSIEKDFFEKQLHHLSIKGFELEGYFIDIGIPEDYNKAQHDFKGFNYR
jgi:D-glycero-alpha-D-manno-heptose 1-phosphate guanylyltransferase